MQINCKQLSINKMIDYLSYATSVCVTPLKIWRHCFQSEMPNHAQDTTRDICMWQWKDVCLSSDIFGVAITSSSIQLKPKNLKPLHWVHQQRCEIVQLGFHKILGIWSQGQQMDNSKNAGKNAINFQNILCFSSNSNSLNLKADNKILSLR